MKQWLWSLLILVIAAGTTWYLVRDDGGEQVQADSDRATSVNVVRPRVGEVQDRLRAVGTSQARHSVNVVSEVAGRIAELHFSEGQQVAQGDLLVTLDQRQARADVAVAEAQLTDAEAKYRRAQRLQSSNNVSAAEVEELQASLAVARANLESASTRLEKLQIEAPFDGVLGLREVSLGAYLSPGDVITTLDSYNDMLVRFDVPQRYLGQLHLGQAVSVAAEALGGASVRGQVSELGSRIDPLSRTITVQSELDNRDGRVRPGQFLNVDLTLESREALLIPEQAVLTRGRERFVYVADDGLARQVPLVLGNRSAGEVEVREGLSPEDEVIVNGQDDLNSGDRLRIVEDDNALLTRGDTPERGQDT